MADTAYTPRLRAQFDTEIRGKLTEQFGYANVMQVPRLDKVVLNMGVGEAERRQAVFFCSPRTTVQRFSFEIGLLSSIHT